MVEGPLAKIRGATERAFGMAPRELITKSRLRHYSRPRQIAMWVARQLTTVSYQEIARAFGMKDHTTVGHAIGAVEHLIEIDDRNVLDMIQEIDAQLYSSARTGTPASAGCTQRLGQGLGGPGLGRLMEGPPQASSPTG